MRIYPAIDIKDGKCVRLMQGKFDRVKVFNDDPADAAAKWADCGASYLHIVDLDGARFGSSFHNDSIQKILARIQIPIQVGGGIRSLKDVENKINLGVSRVIIGTGAIENIKFVKEAVKEFGEKIAVGIDAMNGMVATHAWEKVSSVSANELCLMMADCGVKTIIYTDISKDGMMMGPNVEKTKEMIELTKIDIIASGGVSNMKDLENLHGIGSAGAIIGKAIYENSIDLKEAIQQFEN